GTDALRFTFLSLASTGRDIKFDTHRLEGYRNFCNKLWNASRYVMMNTQDQDCGLNQHEVELSVADRWIISRLQHTEQQVGKAIDEFRFDHASQALYEFVWNEYCDWYLELSKPVLNDADSTEAAKRGTRRTLVRVLETILRLAHPFMPFITEEIWQQIGPMAGKADAEAGDTIMLQPYPQANTEQEDSAAEADIEWIKGVIVGIRNIRGEMNISPARQLPVLLQKGTGEDERRFNAYSGFLKSLAKLESLTWLQPQDDAPMSAIQLVGDMQVLVPMAGLIDKDAEISRLQKEIDKREQEIKRVEGKLNNPKFVDRAPTDVVEKEKQKISEHQAALKELQTQMNKIKAL
ncbi:MAG: class I tRNA ligase family protein, partial [Ketobacter sp.]|nr:class I tRNA ligase family protein [Ketobacter sp.]